MIRATTRESGSQNNTVSIRNTKGGYFSHFGIIRANSFGGFGAFRGNNNNNPPLGNNNNNNPPLLPPLGFGRGLGGGFNLPSGGNTRGLDPNIVVLVNALTGANLKINYVKRESNHVKLTEFEEQKQRILTNG